MMPIYIDISDYNVLVLGGGSEATKKVSRLIKHRANITVYSLEFSGELKQLAESGFIKILEGDIRNMDVVEKLIRESDLIIYTIPGLDNVEKWIVNTCKKYRKIHIISTNALITQAALPVEISLHGLRFTVFSGGKSTLVALKALDMIKDCLGGREDIGVLLEAMYFLKLYMKGKGIPYKIRMRLYRELFKDKGLEEYISKRELEGAKEYIKKYIDSLDVS